MKIVSMGTLDASSIRNLKADIHGRACIVLVCDDADEIRACAPLLLADVKLVRAGDAPAKQSELPGLEPGPPPPSAAKPRFLGQSGWPPPFLGDPEGVSVPGSHLEIDFGASPSNVRSIRPVGYLEIADPRADDEDEL